MVKDLEVIVGALFLITFFLLVYKGALYNRSAMYRPFISLLLFVKNQEESIENIINQIHSLHGKSCFPFEVIVVDTLSTDQTGDILERLSLRYGFTLIKAEGKAKSPLEEGLFCCHGNLTGILDLDRLPPGKVIPTLKSLLCPA